MSQRPTKRLLIAPALLLGGIVAVVIAVPSVTARPGTTSAAVEPLPAALTIDEDCRRGLESPVDLDPLPADDHRVTSALLVDCPARFDGRIVTYVGELVGDLLPRHGGAWVLANDDEYALRVGPLPTHRDHRGTNGGVSVWLPDELVGGVTGLGRPGRRGDVVQIQGRVERTDPADGGGLTVRAFDLEVLRPSETFHEPFDVPQAVLALVSLVASAALWTVRRGADGAG